MARKAGKRSNKKHQMTGETGDSYGLNEIDDFASKRDQILLENSNLGTQGADDYESNPDDEEEEVMAMSNEETSSEEEDEEEEEEQEQTDEELDGEQAYRKVFGRKLELHRDPAEDEGGMLGNDNAWGSTKGDYYGADDIDDEETAKEVEKEALRQKKKHLEELNMNDYLDDDLDEEWSKSAKEFDVGEFKESTKQDDKTASIKDILNMDSEAKKNHLQTLFPEFIPLSKEMIQLSDLLEELKSEEESEITKLKICALSTYLGTLSSYFGILLHELNNNDTFATMRDHPVMEMILTSKEVWRQASSLAQKFDQENESQDDDDEDMADPGLEQFDEGKLDGLRSGNSEDVEESDQEEKASEVEDQEEADDDDSEDDDDVDLDDFEEYVAQSRISKSKINGKQESARTDDYVEGEMADVDSQEKKARKRTLRFYTSKIDQSENKKLDKFKGDDDIPYKERFFERQQRLLEEARKRGQQGPSGADLDTKDYNSGDEATSKAMNNESEKDYFNLTQKRRQERKGARQQAHKEAVKAARDGKLAELVGKVGEDGKRAINYQILKNKGLTPKRKKDDRNSRVKKRKKYEKAQKKLKSVRAVYSGGQSGVYEGEKTGIKKNLTKSVKFKN
mgnify:CR=1 FL=1